MAQRSLPPAPRDPDIAGLARVLGDGSRVAMLDALMDGDAHTIGALARRAGVTAPTASTHLERLRAARLVTVTTAGRERQVRLASPEVAELIERLACLAIPDAAPTVAGRSRIADLRFARTCYDHLAGMLGVVVANALLERGWLHRTTDTFEPAPALFEWLADHGAPLPIAGRRPLSRACLDWTERVPHLAGRTGEAVANVFARERWVTRRRDSRALRLTDRGRAALGRELGIQLPTPRTA
jgi:DNA-binding transcriptional ArsR family regulator